MKCSALNRTMLSPYWRLKVQFSRGIEKYIYTYIFMYILYIMHPDHYNIIIPSFLIFPHTFYYFFSSSQVSFLISWFLLLFWWWLLFWDPLNLITRVTMGFELYTGALWASQWLIRDLVDKDNDYPSPRIHL